MLRLNNVKVRYKDVLALDMDREIVIESGHKVGVVGANGAGKSTLVKAILGIVNYEGDIEGYVSPKDIAVHLQENNYAELPCKVIMEMILGCSIKEMPLVLELIDLFEFEPLFSRKFSKLSGGQKQKFTMIMVLCQEKPLTIVDEVTSGLDFENRQLLIEKIQQWYQKRKGSLIIVSHYYDELEKLADKLLILDKGKVIGFGPVDHLFKKYCGQMVITMDYSPEREVLFDGFKRISAKKGVLAYSFDDNIKAKEMTEILLDKMISYKQCTKDLELIIINAKEAYYEDK